MDARVERINGFYTINGKRMPSVTTVLGKMLPHEKLDAWQARTPNHKEVGYKAAIRGNFMHMRILGRYSDAPMEIPAVMPEEDWPAGMVGDLEKMDLQWDEIGLNITRPCLVEHTTHSNGRWPYAGTVDGHMNIEGRKTILDLKSARVPQRHHRLQLGAYAHALAEHGIETEWGMVAYVRPTNTHLVEMDRPELDAAWFEFEELIEKFYQDYM